MKRFEGRILEIAEHNRQKALSTGKEEGTIIAMPGAKQLLNQVRHPVHRRSRRSLTMLD